MQIDILTIFPDQVRSFLEYGIYRICAESGNVEFVVHDLRNWAVGKHRSVDDRPYGGGAGMILKVDVVDRALSDIKKDRSLVILPTPKGKVLNQVLVKEMYNKIYNSIDQVVFLCGHYEGFDERVHQHLADLEISIGDYVLSGGELSSLVIIDSLVRNIPGVLGNDESVQNESFENNYLEYPQYTRPEEYKGWKVPEVLLSGNHKHISSWREDESKIETERKRPDLLKKPH